MTSNVIKALEWRYATKVFDTNKKLSDDQVHTLLDAMRLSASSFGLQPWKFILVKNPQVREELFNNAYGQIHVRDASHLIVIASKINLDENDVLAYVKQISDERGVPVEMLQGYKDMMVGFVKSKSKEDLQNWMQKQTYIAMGTLLSTAAMMDIDACPMEGFDKVAFDKILGLTQLGFASQTICPIGYRSSEDQTASYKKIRIPFDQAIMEV